MNNPGAMNGIKRVAELRYQRKRKGDRHSAVSIEVLVERLADERIENEIRSMRTRVPEVDESDNVWMPNPCQQIGLSLHPGSMRGLVVTNGSQPFYGNEASVALVASQVDTGRTSLANLIQ